MRLWPGGRTPGHELGHGPRALLLALGFSALYLAAGPGCFFSVDEVAVLETARGVLTRGTLEVPAVGTAVRGRGDAYYAHRAPALGYVALPLVAVGEWIDRRGSLAGGAASGPPRETLTHPLRWGGRAVAFAALATNAAAGGAIVALLYLLAIRLGAAARAALAFAVVSGLASSVFSESTHFFQHPLEALYLLLAFWAFAGPDLAGPCGNPDHGGSRRRDVDRCQRLTLAGPCGNPDHGGSRRRDVDRCQRLTLAGPCGNPDHGGSRRRDVDRCQRLTLAGPLGTALLGGCGLALALLSRPNAAPAGLVIGLYGLAAMARARRRDGGVRSLRAGARFLGAAVALPAVAVAVLLAFNRLQFDRLLDFGYRAPRESFDLEPARMARAVAGYLVSPSLSVFLFAPPLLLLAIALRDSLRRRPLETRALLAAAAAHLALLSTYGVWHGDLSFGPRFMLAPVVLLLPLTLPAFESAFAGAAVPEAGRRRARGAIAAVLLLGLAVQSLGVAVDVTANEWHRQREETSATGAWVFRPSSSPIAVHGLLLLRGEYLAPWALRVLDRPGPGLALLAVLGAIAAASALALLASLRARPAGESDAGRHPDRDPAAAFVLLPRLVALVSVLLIGAGLAGTRRVTGPAAERVLRIFARAVDQQRQGRAVAAASDYALVLSLAPDEAQTLHNLGTLEAAAGRVEEAAALYGRSLALDPTNTATRCRLLEAYATRARRRASHP